jgi:hypothetical protein
LKIQRALQQMAGYCWRMDDKIASQAERLIALEAELESAGEVSLAEAELAWRKAALHEWVESVVGVVASPGLGRVTLIHSDGNQSSISSRTLPFMLSRPAKFEGE